MFDFLFALIELFSISVTVPSYEAKCVQLFLQGVDLFAMHSTFIWTGSSPSTILGIRNLEALRYPAKTASFCVPSFWLDTGVWQTGGQTNWQTDMPPVAYTTLANLAMWCAYWILPSHAKDDINAARHSRKVGQPCHNILVSHRVCPCVPSAAFLESIKLRHADSSRACTLLSVALRKSRTGSVSTKSGLFLAEKSVLRVADVRIIIIAYEQQTNNVATP